MPPATEERSFHIFYQMMAALSSGSCEILSGIVEQDVEASVTAH